MILTDCNVTETHNGTNIFPKDIVSGGSKATILIDSVNLRLKVQSYEGEDLQEVARTAINTAQAYQLGKVIFYALGVAAPTLEEAGYRQEGRIQRFFSGREAFCYSYFVDPLRSQSPYLMREDEVLIQARKHKPNGSSSLLPAGYSVQPVEASGAEALAQLYRTVFSSYPTPIMDPSYVRKVMQSHVYFLAVYYNGTPVSAASAEIDYCNLNAEMTDCATLDEHRGRGLVTLLLNLLEAKMWELNLGVVYSLSRAGSLGMNAALNKIGFTFNGRFINNCRIGGRFEDMNLWVKIRSGS